MKKFEAPELEILTFTAEDVLTESNIELPDPGDNGTPIG